jgi:hypothetical protein
MSKLSVTERLQQTNARDVAAEKAAGNRFGKDWVVKEDRQLAIKKGGDNQYLVSGPDGIRVVTLQRGKELG